MVKTMVSAYTDLSEDERERVFLLAVGKDIFKSEDQSFCQGFAACADDSDNSWWTAWDAEQRDVFFYIKKDPTDNDSWEYHCRYSMNTGRDEFDNTIREMLDITAPRVDIEVGEDDLAGNGTSIESEALDLDVDEPSSYVSDPSPSYVSSSSSPSIFMPFLMLSAAALGWSIV